MPSHAQSKVFSSNRARKESSRPMPTGSHITGASRRSELRHVDAGKLVVACNLQAPVRRQGSFVTHKRELPRHKERMAHLPASQYLNTRSPCRLARSVGETACIRHNGGWDWRSQGERP
eukprot:scaffold18997_cov28-Tisochrysis_lutea.AAC.3